MVFFDMALVNKLLPHCSQDGHLVSSEICKTKLSSNKCKTLSQLASSNICKTQLSSDLCKKLPMASSDKCKVPIMIGTPSLQNCTKILCLRLYAVTSTTTRGGSRIEIKRGLSSFFLPQPPYSSLSSSFSTSYLL